MKNYYDILQVNQNASTEIIEKAYRVLAKKYHPDAQTDEIEKLRCEQILKDLNEAYYVLSDVFLREQYDKELQNIKMQNMNTSTKQENIENNSNIHNNSNDKFNLNNFIKNRNANKKQESKQKKQNYQDTENYEVGTFSAILAIIKRLLKDTPDVKNIKRFNKKDIGTFIIALVIVLIICVILWFIPFTNSFIRNIFFLK